MSPRDLPALCEVVDTMVEWCEGADVDITGERETLTALRIFAGNRCQKTAEALIAASHSIYPHDAVTGPRRTLRETLLTLGREFVRYSLRLGSGAPVDPSTLPKLTRQLLGFAATLGAELGVKNHVKVARAALERGLNEGRKTSRFPEPGFARQLAMGGVLLQLRETGLLESKDVCAALESRGVKLTPQSLARLESGAFVKNPPLAELATVLRVTIDELNLRAEAAHEFSRLAAARFGFEGERWFATMVSEFGQKTARACVAWHSVAAALMPIERLKQR